MDIVLAIREMHVAVRNYSRLFAISERRTLTDSEVNDMDTYGSAMAEQWEAIAGWLGQGGWSPIAKDWRYRP
jgi:hypothetical protein